MARSFDEILDECVDRINQGAELKDCLASHPEHAEELEPLLRTILETQLAYAFTPSPEARMATKQRFNAALEESVRKHQGRRPLLPLPMQWSKPLAAVAALLLIALIGYYGLRPTLFPSLPVTERGQIAGESGAEGPGPSAGEPGVQLGEASPQPSLEANLVFLISDEVNAIADFQSLEITILRIGLQQEGKADQWIELNPQVEVVDLTLLQGDKAREIWSGSVPEGRYGKVFIYVSNVSGVLKETDSLASVKLPSDKLRISKAFEIGSASVVHFVYDVTVVEAGKSDQYILKPQVGQSGVNQKIERVE
jgi:hypothetical protein